MQTQKSFIYIFENITHDLLNTINNKKHNKNKQYWKTRMHNEVTDNTQKSIHTVVWLKRNML